MSLEAGRVGVRNDQVDAYGRINANASFIDDIIRDLPGWTDMPVWRGGTEVILPENDDEPETSPILADIQYPDALRNNQYFLYRESPTTVDGKAKIRRILGNTLVWNQLVRNGNYESVSVWQGVAGATYTVSNNVATVSVTDNQSSNAGRVQQNIPYDSTHKYYFRATVKNNSPVQVVMYIGGIRGTWNANNGAFETKSAVFQVSQTGPYASGVRFVSSFTGTYTYEIKNFIVIDLTRLFGAGNEPTLEQFEQWLACCYPLDYYSDNGGKLLSFNGTGLMTANADETETNVISLPTLDFFPTGMKSAGSVCDELLPDKAITRIGSIDLGTLSYVKQTSTRFMTGGIIDANYPTSGRLLNFVCPKFIPSIDTTPYTAYGSDDRRFYFYTNADEFADAAAFKTAMSGVLLYYELVEPIIEPTIIIE